ncbi:MAG: CoA ester lyase [Candidatus Accumulibacter sp.]|jgi:citrate lyase subunit beta/citryl-CoA lyase|nr:CoA ester lyase [Accumulibacter sp.]
MRSKLFVPASRPELFAKALAGEADALSFDLEDAVAESRKEEARENLRAFLDSPAARESGKTLIVRVNPLSSPHFWADIETVVSPGVDLVNLPKPESAREVREAAAALAAVESHRGMAAPVRLLLNIETPGALRAAHELASAHPRVAGLQLGFADLFGPLAITRDNAEAVAAAMFMARMAAGEAGIFVCDSAYADIKNPEGFRAEAERARRFGFIGKSCIHPSQVALANAVFRPSDEEIAHAVKVVESVAGETANGVGAYVVDGKMIDEPFVRRARAVVAQARGLGLLPAQAGN